MMRNALVQASFSHSHLQQPLAQAGEVVIGVLGTTRAASVERRTTTTRTATTTTTTTKLTTRHQSNVVVITCGYSNWLVCLI